MSLFILLFSLKAFAYIPSSQFVFDRVADLHGKGAYKVTQEVTFKTSSETQVVKEHWIIIDGGEMLVRATGTEFQLARLLKRGRIYWNDGSEHASEPPVDYYMAPLITRNPLDLKRFFVKWGALPPEALREKYVPKDSKQIKVETEKFVKLGRVNGAVQYQYGQPDGAGLWVEQDHFFITKMRAPSGAEFLAQDYIIFSRGLALPKTQTVTFNDNKVEIKILNVVGINLTNDIKKQMDPTYFRKLPENATQWPQHGLSSVIQDFYKRFR